MNFDHKIKYVTVNFFFTAKKLNKVYVNYLLLSICFGYIFTIIDVKVTNHK